MCPIRSHAVQGSRSSEHEVGRVRATSHPLPSHRSQGSLKEHDAKAALEIFMGTSLPMQREQEKIKGLGEN